MNYSRRALLAAGATGGLALTAGCLDFVRGDGPLELSAEQVRPTDDALEETEYDEYEIDEQSMEETVDVGVERDIEATIWSSVYSKEIDYQGIEEEACFFAAVSIPDVSVLGYSLNPIDDMDNDELLEEFMGEVDSEHADFDNVSHADSFSLDILDDSRDVDRFEGETEIAGQQVDVDIGVTSFSHDDDVLVLLSSYPADLEEESEHAETLMESVEHPA
ncbi:DUF6517 family protein [Natronorubrum daqingense]|uniref:Uncharacterized protein n=1 Tax=Natronorubrum daqingense TaxID=588898 RepID=A0A1N7DW05_9EURY|nr:DUF6517 family protein [Natronorubrum daqingense]APX96208.1 hypothetical protein BB347_05980 [Natronorubrum daqingense]SIR79961.1 hypothetical protein SAMN05421809_2278 [Natronorubrum daqingense]